MTALPPAQKIGENSMMNSSSATMTIINLAAWQRFRNFALWLGW
jgi:hypothetical protein